jgi:long-chain acyl-CoA synthetase
VSNADGTFRFIALYSKNRAEWSISDYGAMLTGIVTVPLYDTLGKEFLDFILNQTQIRTVSLSSDKISSLLSLKSQEKLPYLKNLIYFDECSQEDKELAASLDVKLICFDEAVKEGKEMNEELKEVTGDSIYTLCYTSGTTGNPKGTMLTH